MNPVSHASETGEDKSFSADASKLDQNVVLLVNIVAPNLIEVGRELSRRIRNFTILTSVSMEANRQWQPEWEGIQVIVQRTKSFRYEQRHPNGFTRESFMHFPLDTLPQLRRLRPDTVISLELGARSATTSLYRRFHRQCRHLIAVFASEHTEMSIGRLRTWQRQRLLSLADGVTYNGPSGKQYLQRIGVPSDKLFPWSYAADPRKIYRGSILNEPHGSRALRLLTIGQLTNRKGVLPAAQQLAEWARLHPDVRIEWKCVGTGEQADELRNTPRPDNLHLDLPGHCDPEELRRYYEEFPVLLFPTLGDEWGLVVDEAMASGMAVIGSRYSQAAETLIANGRNGWTYDPLHDDSLGKQLDRWLEMSPAERLVMREHAREDVAHRTPAAAAQELVHAIQACHARRR